ncbi:MAG: hypothetical protein ACQEP3_03495, partial [Patescibacteria group bacterium]
MKLSKFFVFKYLFPLVIIICIAFLVFYNKNNANEKETSPWLHAEEVTDNRLEEQRNNYLQEMGWKLGVSKKNPNNAYLGWGQGYIDADKKDKDYGQKRIEAFERAFTEAVSSLAKATESEKTINIIDDKPLIQNYLKKWESHYGSSNFLKDGYISEKESSTYKFILFEMPDIEEIDKITITDMKSRLNLSGVMVETTFETEEKIGVLIRHSEQTKSAAHLIGKRKKGLSEIYNSRIHINQLEQLKKEDLVFMHGIRILEIEDGENILLSFGQWSPKSNETDEETIKSAKQKAFLRANSAIAQFIENEIIIEHKTATISSDEAK